MYTHMWSKCCLHLLSVHVSVSESSCVVKDGKLLCVSTDCSLHDVLHDNTVYVMKYVGLYDNPIAAIT